MLKRGKKSQQGGLNNVRSCHFFNNGGGYDKRNYHGDAK